ncbi:MAG: hypothetical protein PF489_00565 [Salinivirgaceae bacterium]|jgi:hypothetical protein|nr:hypothetical protein [Salinivirgaceae bacterium]
MNTQKVVPTTVENKEDATVTIRQCRARDEKAVIICQKLKYNPISLSKKKTVWTTGETRKNYPLAISHLPIHKLQCGLNTVHL